MARRGEQKQTKTNNGFGNKKRRKGGKAEKRREREEIISKLRVTS